MSVLTQCLNWKEIFILSEKLSPLIANLFVDRIVVPERTQVPGGYFKGEWAVRLSGKRREFCFIFSVRPRHPYITLLEGRGPRAAVEGTHSPFDLALSKQLRGARLTALEPLPRERTLLLWFEADRERLALALQLIPSIPEALLLRDEGAAGLRILARSRTLREPLFFKLPDGSQAPPNPAVRQELVESPEVFHLALETAIGEQAFELRLRAGEKQLREQLKHARGRLRQSEVAIKEAESEPDWQRYADLLKSTLGQPDDRVIDFETGQEIEVPRDPQLSPQEQVEKYYHSARRKTRRLLESLSRAEQFRETIARWEKALAAPPAAGDWSALEKLERAAGAILPARAPETGAKGGSKSGGGKKSFAWLGKTFTSRDGIAILVGKSRDENLELTFKHARANDLWMHVRGRPGAHVVIPVQSGKSTPLETLLDAANLCLFYSGGEKWGTTEVDYAFKKHVKRIKDSTEASYTHNKTLLVQTDPARLKRLLGGEGTAGKGSGDKS